MSDEPLPTELAELFAAERAAPLADAATKAMVRSKLATTIARLPLAGAGAFGAGKILAVLAITVGVGAGTVAVTNRAESTPSAPPPPALTIAHEETPAPEPPAVVPVEVAPPAPEPTLPSPHAMPSPAAEPTPPLPPSPAPELTPSPASQGQLLTRARAALRAGDATTALALVREDYERHPGGGLAEERAAIEILAFVKLARTADARSALDAFATRFPTSVYLAYLNATVARQEKP